MGYPYVLILFLSFGFVKLNAEIKKEFQVLEFAVDGLETNPLSIATLINHDPRISFPDVFTLCWRSRTSFARYFWSWNYIEIPLRPGERFMALHQRDNATHSHMQGEEIIKYKKIKSFKTQIF